MAENQKPQEGSCSVDPGSTEIHPKGQLCLLDGTLLTAYDRSVPMEKKTQIEEEQTKQLFYKNAFLFLRHSREILSDSRMFLAPVCVDNNLAYIGGSGLINATLGVYIEWWHKCEQSIQEEDNQKWLVWHIAGSPLSGSNRCCMVNEQGKIRSITLRPFFVIWSSFMKINRRYDPVKPLYDAYSLDEVVDMLTNEEDEKLDHGIDEFYLRQQCSLLNKMLNAEKRLVASLRKRIANITIAFHEAKAKDILDQYRAMEEKNKKRKDELEELLKRWKTKMKCREITGKEYQKAITPLKKELEALSFERHWFLFNNRISEDVKIDDIIDYFDQKNKQG